MGAASLTSSLQVLRILWVQSPLASRHALGPAPLPHLPPQMPAGLYSGGREESQGEDMGGEAALKEHCSGAEGLGPSLTSATYCVTPGKASSSVK